jgi:endo-1,4-beta-xylanase
MTTRRQFFIQATSTAIGLLHRQAFAAPQSIDSMRDAAASRGLLAGCAVAVDRLRDDPRYADLVRSQAGIVVAENEFKFGRVHPLPGSYFFDDADYLAEFAASNHMKLRGHNFVWHRSLPAWFESYVTRQNAEKVLVEHIERVGGRYAGRIHSWDVVNEAIEVKDGLPGGLRDSVWQRVLSGYIDTAYRTARRVDPAALLVYNDYGIEAEDPESAKKREAVLQLLRGMKQRGVPVDGLGIQSHIYADPAHVYGKGLQHLIDEARAMGLQVLLTEMDANDRYLPPDIEVRDAAVARAYGSYLATALANPVVIALLTWGITDRYTWLNGENSRSDKLAERPLPFDRNLNPKPAFTATRQALESAPERTPHTVKEGP